MEFKTKTERFVMKTQFNDGEFHVCAELKERRYNEVGDVRPVK